MVFFGGRVWRVNRIKPGYTDNQDRAGARNNKLFTPCHSRLHYSIFFTDMVECEHMEQTPKPEHIISQRTIVYIRNLIFGVEDSLVSTVDLLSGVAAAGVPRSVIFLTGVVLIFVEA